MLCNLSYWAPELHGSVATWTSRLFYLFEQLSSEKLSYWALELHGSVATWPSGLSGSL